MRVSRKTAVATMVTLAVAALIAWGFMEGRKEVHAEREREKPIAAPSRVVHVGGAAAVKLDAAAMARAGIVTAPLASASIADQKQAFATVADLAPLLDVQKSYVTARADAEKASADVETARREYERLRALNADRKNVSDKAVESAYGTLRGAQATAESANASARAAYASAQQRWGGALAQRVTSAEGLTPFISLAEVVLQVSLPADAAAPSAISVVAADGRTVTARFLSVASRTDPKLQGRTFLYIAPGAAAGLLPGMNVKVRLSSGPANAGVLVPTPAVVWTSGASWAYVEQTPGFFVRRPVPLDTPSSNGWFVRSGFAAGERVVVSGAQLLLSEEFRSQIQVGEEEKR